MIALTRLLPRKSSRTSTQAVIVPSTAFVAAASAATPNVSLSAATASGPLTASQKLPPEAVLREHRLRGRGFEVLDELVRLVLVRAPREDRDRQLDQHRLARNHVLEVPALEARVDRLALIGDQDIALAAEERVRRVRAR